MPPFFAEDRRLGPLPGGTQPDPRLKVSLFPITMDATAQDTFLFADDRAGRAEGWGRTHPNPMVGALIMENGEVVGRRLPCGQSVGSCRGRSPSVPSVGQQSRSRTLCFPRTLFHRRTAQGPPCTERFSIPGLNGHGVATLTPTPATLAAKELLREAGVEVILAEGKSRNAVE